MLHEPLTVFSLNVTSISISIRLLETADYLRQHNVSQHTNVTPKCLISDNWDAEEPAEPSRGATTNLHPRNTFGGSEVN